MTATPRPHQLDAWQAARLMARRELSAVELMRSCLDQIARREPEVHAFACRVDANTLLAQARELDGGVLRGPLNGLPLGVKDLFDTTDLPTSYGSAIYAGHRPVSEAATVAQCREAGAVVVISGSFAQSPMATQNTRPSRIAKDVTVFIGSFLSHASPQLRVFVVTP